MARTTGKRLLQAHRDHVRSNRARPATLEAMERIAKNATDGTCSLQIRGHWLEVHWRDGEFEYKWGVNIVPRVVAESVRRSA
jgi:hypothetical protein